MQSRVGAVARLILIDLIGSVVWFPVWWYSSGLLRVLRWMKRTLRFRVKEYDFAIWIRNFFVPMYGQHDLTGRLVSVFMRFVVLVGRLIALGVEILLDAAGLLAWIAAPALCFIFFVANIATSLAR